MSRLRTPYSQIKRMMTQKKSERSIITALNKADAELTIEQKSKLLFPATNNGDLDALPNVVDWLLAHGANPRIQQEETIDTPLHNVMSAFPPTLVSHIIQSLLAAGADPNALNAANRTPLHEAASIGHPTFVRALINGGANVNVRDRDGNTPLMIVQEIQEDFRLRGINSRARLSTRPLHDLREKAQILLAAGAIPTNQPLPDNLSSLRNVGNINVYRNAINTISQNAFQEGENVIRLHENNSEFIFKTPGLQTWLQRSRTNPLTRRNVNLSKAEKGKAKLINSIGGAKRRVTRKTLKIRKSRK